MPFRNLLLTPNAPTIPAPQAVPLTATSPGIAHESMKALDTLHASGGRILLELGLRGGDQFLIPNGEDPDSGSTPYYPDKDTPRVVGRNYQVTITPGSFVGIDVLAIPSGPVQRFDGGSAYLPDGAGGTVELEVTYTNGDGQSKTAKATVDLAPSGEAYAAETPNPFGEQIIKSATAMPVLLIPSAAEWEKWTRGGDVVADITVRYIGSPRVVDLAVVERPHSITVDTADSRWPTAMYSHNSAPYQQLPVDYPVQQLSDTDPGGGVAAIRRALASHGRELGPCLFAWSSATEHVGDIFDHVSYHGGTGDDEAPPASMTGTTRTLLPFGTTPVSDELPGWTTASYARQVDHGDQFLDGRTGVLPVWVAARCRSFDPNGGPGPVVATFDLETDADGWSRISWSTSSTSWGWVLTPGWLEVGTGAEDDRVVRLWAKTNDATYRAQIRDLAVFQQVRG